MNFITQCIILIFFQDLRFLDNGAVGQIIRIHLFKSREIDTKPFFFGGRPKPTRTPRPRVNTKGIIPRYNFDNPGDGSCRTPENKHGICKEYSECAQFYHSLPREVNDWHIYKCWISGPGEFKPNGLCCPIQDQEFTTLSPSPSTVSTRFTTVINTTQSPVTISTDVSFREFEHTECKYETEHLLPCFENVEDLNEKVLRSSLSAAEHIIRKSKATEEELLSQKTFAVQQGPFENGYHPLTKESESSISAEILVETSRKLASTLRLQKRQKIFGLKNVNSTIFPELNKYCVPNPICNLSKYRSFDGACNNVEETRQGQSLTPLKRILPPSYADGLQDPRVALDCSQLPNARILSRSLNVKNVVPSDKYSLFFVQFSQFLFSDFGSTRTSQFENSGIQCCRDGQFLPDVLQHDRCYPIGIRENDVLYSQQRRRCANYVRAQIAPRSDCSLGYADQINVGTHWIDMSNLYGSNLEEANDLRLYRNGFLRVSRLSGNKQLLPLRETTGDGCTIPEQGIFCFHAGDQKVNEQTGLLITHLLWLREHNRVAAELKSINIDWSDEEVYQETRRIVIAEYQHITYTEWLPLLIGKNRKPWEIQQKEKYKGLFDRDSSVSNEFYSAAFRIENSLEQGIVNLMKEFGRSEEFTSQQSNPNYYNNPHNIRARGQIDKWIKGLLRQPASKILHSYHEPYNISEQLFQARGFSYEPDFASYIIQRGRDVGLPGYNFYRELCFRSRVQRFEEMIDFIDKEMIVILKHLYKNVDDIDLWIGGLLERPLADQFVGPTFACIIHDQFFRSKQGDQYFYDKWDQLHSFSGDQLVEIRKATFARILCDNGDRINRTQPSAFLLPHDKTNPTVRCNDIQTIPRVDLRLWENEPTPPEATTK